MDFYIFSVILIFTLLAYFPQIIKLFKLKDSTGVSLNGAIVCLVGTIVFFILSENMFVSILSALEICLSLLTILYILKYQNENDVKENYNSIFILSLVSSFFMIFSLSQVIKSFKNKMYSNVSKTTYFFSIILDLLLLLLVENEIIIVATIVNIFTYIYIIYKTYTTNKVYKIEQISNNF